jgi:type IV secretion system protein VirD4
MTNLLERGIPLGTPILRARSPLQEPLWDVDDGHLITFAPTGAGKGVSCIIPALLCWDGPAIVIDPKGENYAVTATRRRAFGHRVALLDPFGVTGSSKTDRLNPLDLIGEDSPFAADDAAVIAKLCTQGQYFRGDPFWDERAETLITGLVLYAKLLAKSPRRNLAEVRHAIEASTHDQHDIVTTMRKADNPEMQVAANILGISGEMRVRTSIIATASSHMSFLRSGPVQNSTQNSSIDLEDVRLGNKLTIYLVLPPDKLLSHGKLLRLWLGTLMTVMARRRQRPHRPTLLLIDEAAQLGPMDELRSAITLMRGYGIRCWSFWQDLSQIQTIYPRDWQSLINNCAVQQYFGMSSPQAAHQIETYLGSKMPRPLMQLKPHEALLIRRGHSPQIVRRPDYLHDPAYRDLFQPNPFHAGSAISGNDLEEEMPVPSTAPNVIGFRQRGER